MQHLSRELSKKLYELMPETLEGCENNWFKEFGSYFVSKYDNRILYMVKMKMCEDICPAPTLEDILDMKFIVTLESKLNIKEGGYTSIADDIIYSYLNLGKLPVVETYLWSLLGEKGEK